MAAFVPAPLAGAELVDLALQVLDLLPQRDDFADSGQGDAVVGELDDFAEQRDVEAAVTALPAVGAIRAYDVVVVEATQGGGLDVRIWATWPIV